MNLELILKICIPIASGLVTFIPTFIAWIAAIKAKRKARTEEEKEKAKALLKEKCVELIKSAEQLYSKVDATLKANGQSAGLIKKDSVLSQLQSFALENGLNFSRDEWAEQIDELVKFTREVNSPVKRSSSAIVQGDKRFN